MVIDRNGQSHNGAGFRRGGQFSRQHNTEPVISLTQHEHKRQGEQEAEAISSLVKQLDGECDPASVSAVIHGALTLVGSDEDLIDYVQTHGRESFVESSVPAEAFERSLRKLARDAQHVVDAILSDPAMLAALRRNAGF